MIDASAYNISVKRIFQDGETYFQAKVKELPDVAEYADSPDEAYALAVDSINTTYKYCIENGKAFPSPIEDNDEFSGRITLRVPRTLHRFLVETSETEGVSLNQHMVNILTFYSGVYATCCRVVNVYNKPYYIENRHSVDRNLSLGHLSMVNRTERMLNPKMPSISWGQI